VVLRRLHRSPELSILGTFGLAIIVQEAVTLIAGRGYQGFANPLPGATNVLGVLYPTYRLLLVGVAAVVLLAVVGALSLTRLGVRIRAVAADRGLAETLGVRASRLNLLVFTASAGLAGLAGVLVAPISTISPSMGQSFLFTAFVVVIVGGARVSGVLLAALAVAAVQNLASLWWSPVVAELAVLGLAFVALQWWRRTAGQVVV
jgi:branched-subunit amino acid ABC-type transport system permease component